MSLAWQENDELFRRLVREGHSWQSLPLIFFKLHGLRVEMPRLTVRDSYEARGAWRDSHDLLVEGQPIEVKTRPFAFTSPRDWPDHRLAAFVDTVKKYDGRPWKPFAYVFVSRPTGGMVATCSLPGAAGRWSVLKRYDRVRNFWEHFYAVERQYLVTMERLVAELRRRPFET